MELTSNRLIAFVQERPFLVQFRADFVTKPEETMLGNEPKVPIGITRRILRHK